MVNENVPGPLPANILPFGASTCTSTLVVPALVQVTVVCPSPCEFGVNGFGLALIEPLGVVLKAVTVTLAKVLAEVKGKPLETFCR